METGLFVTGRNACMHLGVWLSLENKIIWISVVPLSSVGLAASSYMRTDAGPAFGSVSVGMVGHCALSSDIF